MLKLWSLQSLNHIKMSFNKLRAALFNVTCLKLGLKSYMEIGFASTFKDTAYDDTELIKMKVIMCLFSFFISGTGG